MYGRILAFVVPVTLTITPEVCALATFKASLRLLERALETGIIALTVGMIKPIASPCIEAEKDGKAGT